jgi:hypothetical protein
VEITSKSRVDLASLELNKVLRRLSAAEWPRRKGYTTVVINPDVVRTRDEQQLKLWNSGLSTEQEEL